MERKNKIPVINPDDESTTLMSLILQSKGGYKKLSEGLYAYKTVMCPKCGKIQVTMAEECFRCRWCNKVSYYRKKGKWHVNFKDFPTHEMACIFAKRWSETQTLSLEKKGFGFPKK